MSEQTQDFLIRFAPTLAGLLVGLVSIVVLPTLRLTRGVRRGLEQDAAVVDKLPRGAQAALRRDMGERAHTVVAYSRHPSMTRTELLAALLIVGAGAFGLSNALADLPPGAVVDPTYVAGSGVLALAQVGTLRVALDRWRKRCVDRLTYLGAQLPADAAHEIYRTTRLGYGIVRVISVVVIVVPFAAVVFTAFASYADASGWWRTSIALVPVAFPSAALAAWLWHALRAPELDQILAQGGAVFGMYSTPGGLGPFGVAAAWRDDQDLTPPAARARAAARARRKTDPQEGDVGA